VLAKTTSFTVPSATFRLPSALAKENIQLERSAIVLAEPIRELGSYEVDVKLHAEVSVKLKVMVTRADA
jgi:ribosomal protein L9